MSPRHDGTTEAACAEQEKVALISQQSSSIDNEDIESQCGAGSVSTSVSSVSESCAQGSKYKFNLEESHIYEFILYGLGRLFTVDYWLKFKTRILYEFMLLLASLPHLLPKVFLLNYGAMYVFRNLAYMRHEQGPRLKDLGYEIITESDNDFYSELNLYVNGAVAVVMVMMPIIGSHAHPRGIFSVNTYMKVINIQCVGHVLRFLTFISTSLPGPAAHCQPGAETYRESLSWHEVFTRRSKVHVDPNCGDLLFSGHMFQVTSFCFIVLGELPKLLPNRETARLVSFALIMTVCIQPYFIIAARNHYSVDVVVSSYVAPMLWWSMEGFYKSWPYKKIVLFFNRFVPYFIENFIKVHNPCIMQSATPDRDDELQFLIAKYGISVKDSELLMILKEQTNLKEGDEFSDAVHPKGKGL